MTITKEINNIYDFEFWSGARDTVEELTYSQLDTIFNILENDVFIDGCTDTELNDFFWFERDTIAEWLGYEDFDAIMEENKEA